MRIALFLLAFVASFFVQNSFTADAYAAQCKNCPPFYCVDPALAARLIAEKKRRAESKGLPKRLSALFDTFAKCEGCIRFAPDWPHITWKVNPEAYEKEFERKKSYE